jgi:hypothetical protein
LLSVYRHHPLQMERILFSYRVWDHFSVRAACPGKVCMDYLELHSEALRIMAVVFVIASIADGKAGRRQESRGILLASIVIPLAAIAHSLGSGISGAVYSLSGAATAGLISAVLSTGRPAAGQRTVSAAAAGSIFGPSGALFIFIVYYVLDIAQKMLRADRSCMSDLLPGRMLRAELIFGGAENNAGPLGKWLRRPGQSERPGSAAADEAGGGNEESTGGGDRLELAVMPWRIKLALASLSVLLSGIFI